MIYFIEKRHISSYRKTIYDSSAKPLLSAGTGENSWRRTAQKKTSDPQKH